MSPPRPTWVVRCGICGESATGHGARPRYSTDHWVCGQCQTELYMDCGMGRPVVSMDLPD